MTDPTNHSEDILKKPGRRGWLRNAAGVVLLLFVLAGCTKEQWDMVKNPKPGGGLLGGTPDQFYRLQADFGYLTGYLLRERPGQGYLCITPDYPGYYRESYKLHPAGDGWQYLETPDGLWLGLTYIGWLYHYDDSTNRVAWKIVDGKLYNNYWSKDNWKKYPAGYQYWEIYTTLDPFAYVGVGFDERHTLTNCKLVPK